MAGLGRNPDGTYAKTTHRPPTCHPERKQRAAGLCGPCYGAQQRTKHGKDKIRDWNLRHYFGISEEVFQRLLTEQGGGCAICGRTDSGRKNPTLLVDHDHETGRVRGVLCHPCNQVLAHAKDDPDLLRKAVQYLNRKYPNV